MKKRKMLCLVLSLVMVLLLLPGCSGSKTTTDAGPTSAQTPGSLHSSRP